MNNCLMNDRNKNGNHEGDSDGSGTSMKKAANTQRNRNVSRTSRAEMQKDAVDINQGTWSSKYLIYFHHIVD